MVTRLVRCKFAANIMDMDQKKKQGRYERIYRQLTDLLTKTQNPLARMATINALLHHKMDGFFWTGFYLFDNGSLVVGPYQGPVACQVLAKNTGVCWAAINREQAVVVPDVESFPGHIACDSRSKSEIALPLYDGEGGKKGVLDVDSQNHDNFSDVDAAWLKKIIGLVYLSVEDTISLQQ
ncbi:MAG TPA: GAF domain-containing protein [Bacteroidales bacterium]|nr:GAF domain-containing protein [Bacteroidales bacterium]